MINSHLISRFTALCQEDERILAGFLCGSYAREAQDEHSDLDLGLITTGESFDEFAAGKMDFVRQLGEPLFLEDFDLTDVVFFILKGGLECELYLAPRGSLSRIYAPVYKALVDKIGLLQGAAFTGQSPASEEQRETLRRQVYWFWHDLSHFITAMARGQHWWAFGQLEALRRTCLNLAHLQHDFSANLDVHDPYFKLEKYLPAQNFAQLRDSICPLEPGAMLDAAHALLRFYRELAPAVSVEHGIAYPEELDRLLTGRLSRIRQ